MAQSLEQEIDIHNDVILPVKEAGEFLRAKLGEGYGEESLKRMVRENELTPGIHYSQRRPRGPIAVNCSRVIQWAFSQCRGNK